MKYKYETHLHTSQGSACAVNTGREMVRAHKENGYAGIFTTDHFFNGNTAVDLNLSWKDKVEQFCRGYEEAKDEGDKIGLDVFFGFEYAFNGTDFLIYNLDKKWLLLHEDIDKTDASSAIALMRSDGAFVVHAHPFRERNYISHIQLCPDWVDAIEVKNGGHLNEPVFDERARWYANSYQLHVTAGSDTHSVAGAFRSSILCEERITDASHYRQMVMDGKIIF